MLGVIRLRRYERK